MLNARAWGILACSWACVFLGCGGDETPNFDFDGDGSTDENDCDPQDATVYPGADEICDCQDNDCDGVVDEGIPDCHINCDGGDDDDSSSGDWTDADGDGWYAEDGDCDDQDPDVHPGAEEICDGQDTNCDGFDDGDDQDGDGFSVCEGDCNDADPNISPTVVDMVGDFHDQNCDGVDGTDEDGDGHASEWSGGTDCDDYDATVNPHADEICDGLDNDCGYPGYGNESYYIDDVDADGDGQYDVDCPTVQEGQYGDPTDCDDTDPTVCDGCFEDNTNGIDDNCNGVIDQFSITITWSEPYEYEYVQGYFVWLMDVTIEGTDLPTDGDLDFYDGYALSWDAYWGGTTLGDDEGEDNMETIEAEDYQDTWMLTIYGHGNSGSHCFVWGADPGDMDPNGNCIWEDPNLY